MKKISVLFICFLFLFSSVSAAKMLIPMGDAVGIRLQLKELMLTQDLLLSDSYFLAAGTSITAINNKRVSSIEEIKRSLQNENTVNVSFQKKKSKLSLTREELLRLIPLITEYTEGIGTLTYVDPETSQYGALGHQIVDQITKNAPAFSNGHLFKVQVKEIKKSQAGLPGYKIALFEDVALGNVRHNLIYGVFGTWNSTDIKSLHEPLEIIQSSEIKIGPAELWTAIKEDEVKRYKISINEVSEDSLTFTITDKALLEATGGIVQGMSGSPIIQNDKFVGAVTHMYVDSPAKGIGILLLEMLEKR